MLSVEEIRSNWNQVNSEIIDTCSQIGRNPNEVTVLSVTKTHPPELIVRAMEAGIVKFGENYAQEMREKGSLELTFDGLTPEWHFIGHLQTNKVKYIAPFVEMIHSVDSVKLAKEISKQAEKNNRNINCLLQVNTSGEHSKSGCSPEEIFKLCESVQDISNISVLGLMTIGSFSDNELVVRKEFNLLREIREDLKARYPENDWKHLSMGMSGDYLLAVEDGATIVRIGTTIFGIRTYKK